MKTRGLLLLLAICAVTASGSKVWAQSICYGTPANGAVEGAVRLVESGANFERYRWKEGEKRTFVHSAVKSVLEDAFDALDKALPDVKFLIGETGLEGGGLLSGHVTHRNGTSVDLFVPVRDASDNSPILFPNDYRNGYGYKVRFDTSGKSSDGKLVIDFAALAEYIYQITESSKKMGHGVQRFILVREFQLKLFDTPRASYLRWNVRFFDDPNDRHDNHLHVDFDVACKSMNELKR
jgi:penicillin-insensitive murein endopeptidase